MIQFIENPILGEEYWVPCAWNQKHWRWFPVVPLLHSDKNFSKHAQVPHYHYDLRFFSNDDYRSFGRRMDGVVRERISEITNTGTFGDTGGELVQFVRKCRRTHTGLSIVNQHQLGFLQSVRDFYRSMVGRSCKGRICPHYGQKMLEKDGQLECPLHGLVGDIATETITGSVHDSWRARR